MIIDSHRSAGCRNGLARDQAGGFQKPGQDGVGVAGRPCDPAALAQLFQGGFVAVIGTEPVVADGRTCLKLPFCHWKTKAAAAPFSPSASNFTGPCTLVSGTPLCR